MRIINSLKPGVRAGAVLGTILATLPVRVFAQSRASTLVDQCTADKDATFLGLPAWYKYIVGPDKCVDVNDPKKLWLIGLAVLEILMRIAVYIALVMVVWGAWKIMSSQGEPDKISAGRKTIQNGLIGLAITIVATVVINYAGNQF
jgi:hypothetical protein